MYTVRYVKDGDFEAIRGLIAEFKEESLDEYDMPFELDTFEKVFEAQKATSVVMETPEEGVIGVLAGFITHSFISMRGVYQEIMWYVSKKHRKNGIKMLKYIEQRCREVGVKQIIMGHMGNSNLEVFKRFYTRNGYKLLETQYIRNLEANDE